MHPGLEKHMMRLRMEAKAKENQAKPPLTAPDVVQTSDFVFSRIPYQGGDSGQLLLAKQRNNRANQYLVKHEYFDCAANEYIYTKLAKAMGYSMPDVVLFQLSPGEKRSYFKSEYIIGEKYMNFIKRIRSFEDGLECAKNWQQYFSFQALYSMTDEGDKLEIYLANDSKIYRIDTTDAFPLHDRHYEDLGAVQAYNFSQQEKVPFSFPDIDLSHVFNSEQCDRELEIIQHSYPDGQKYYLEPFARIQEVIPAYIDDFLNTLCYFYPDCIGDFFKQYFKALQQQAYEYLKAKR